MTPREGSTPSVGRRRVRRRSLVAGIAAVVLVPIAAVLGYHWQPVVNWRIEREARAHLADWQTGDEAAPFAPVEDGALTRAFDVESTGTRLSFAIYGSACPETYAVRTVASDAAVVLLVIRANGPKGLCPAMALRRAMTLDLPEALGARVLFDGATGERLLPRQPVP